MAKLESTKAIEQMNSTLAGRYLIEREIGQGGMATVYLARDLRHDRKVALKLLLPELGAILGPERFLSEIRVTANLQHPNLLPLFDSGEADGRLYYVMPYVDGETLRHRLSREKQLPVDESVRIAVACVSALDYAHRNGVIHRDLKPENILLSAGQPMIADFGIALAVSNAGGARITHSGLSLGTPQYMSPEQAAGDREVDGRSDIYSLACVLYEMLTGDPPHTGSTVQAIIAKVLVEKPRGPRAQRDTIPEHVDAAIQRALAKLPADRWATAAQFGDALTQPGITQAARTSADVQRVSAPYPVARSRYERVIRRAIWPAIALVAAVIAGLGWWGLLSVKEAFPTRFTLATPASAQLLEFQTTPVVLSPDGHSIAYVGRATASGGKLLFLRRLDQLDPVPIPGTDDATMPFFSPDGRWIGFFTGSDRSLMKKVLVTGGGAMTLSNIHSHGASWTSGGTIVLAGDEGLYKVPAAGGTPQLFVRTGTANAEAEPYRPLILPDDRTVIFALERRNTTTGSIDSRLAIASLDKQGHEILELSGTDPVAYLDGHLFYGRDDGTVMTVPFDIRRRKATGEAVVVLEQVAVQRGRVSASVASNGSVVYVKASNASQLIITNEHGIKTVGSAETNRFRHPRLSPDGRRVALEIENNGKTRSDIWVYDASSGVYSRLTSLGQSERPEWTPDGKRIAYSARRGDTWEAWWVPADGSGAEERLYAFPNLSPREVTFSPDGKLALFRVDDPERRRDLWILPLNTDTSARKATPLLTTGFDELGARVSPDGRWLAYVSDETGRYEVYVRPFPGPGGRVQVSSSGGSEPLWSGNGLRIVYRSNGKFVAATLSASPGISVVGREELFDDKYRSQLMHPEYDVDRTGKQFVLLQSFGNTELVVMLNGLEQILGRGSGKQE